jgi:ribose/xylose/arabinose/galactoside ABC-type transport system permease subunit
MAAETSSAEVNLMPVRVRLSAVLRFTIVFAFLAVFIFLSIQAPSFFNGSNLLNLLVNNFALLALVSLGMTLVTSTGGIDLSVGTAIDIGSLVYSVRGSAAVSSLSARNPKLPCTPESMSGAPPASPTF